MGATWVPNAPTSSSSVRSNEARSRSILFTTTARGSPASAASSQIISVWTSTPSTAETTNRHASAARSAPRTSPMKSAYPGVSRTLILRSSQSTGARVVETLIPRRISSAS